MTKNMKFVKEVRGRGLFCACEIYPEADISFKFRGEMTKGAWAVTYKLLELGLLAKPTHDNIIRLCPDDVFHRFKNLFAISKSDIIEYGSVLG